MKYFILRFLLITVISTPIYLLVRRPWRYKDKREIFLGVFVIYFIGLLCLVFEGRYGNPVLMFSQGLERLKTMDYVNFVPFKTIKIFFGPYVTTDEFLVNIFSNVVIFIPWGFFITLLWKANQKKPYLPVIYSFLLPVVIESVQLFIGRNTDIDDVILNFLGAVIGIVFFFLISLKSKKITQLAK